MDFDFKLNFDNNAILDSSPFLSIVKAEIEISIREKKCDSYFALLKQLGSALWDRFVRVVKRDVRE